MCYNLIVKRIIVSEKQKALLIKKRRRLLKQISELSPFIKGSLSRLYRICGAKNCACKKGGNKHEALYLTWKEDCKTKSLYVPVEMHKETIQWVQNYKKLKTLIKKLSSLQQDILRLR